MAQTGGPFIVPPLGDADLYPHALKMASIIVAATTSDGDEDIIVGSDTALVNLFDVQANVWVANVVGVVETAFTASVALGLGDSDQAFGWASAVMVGATSTGLFNPNVDSDALTSDDLPVYKFPSMGKHYPSSQTIDLEYSGAEAAVGRLRVVIFYANLGSSGGTPLST